jgi:hypothetical protein
MATTPTAPPPAAGAPPSPAPAGPPPTDSPPTGGGGSASPPAPTSSPGNPAPGGQTGPDATPPAAAPIELKLPEGVDAKQFDAFRELAGKHGLKGEAAQAVVDHYLERQQAATKANQTAMEKSITDARESWRAAALADKEIAGGDPQKFAESLNLAERAVLKFGGRELLETLGATGLGSHPTVVRAFVRVGKAMAEDSISGTTGGSGQTSHPDEALMAPLYTSMKK